MLNQEIKDLLEEINQAYKDTDWLVVKKYLLKSINPEKRKLFSKRNYLTKKHSINDYENKIISFYEEKFNIKLKLKEEDKHKELFWQRKNND